MTAVNWRDTLASAPREDIPVHRKSRDFFFPHGLELGVKDGGVVAPGGLVPTHQIEGLFRRIVANAAQVSEFDRLPIPFRAVATDLESGEMVVFDRGDLAVAMRASMAVPGAFAPVDLNGRRAGRWHAGAQPAGRRRAPDLRRRGRSRCRSASPAVAREKLGNFVGVAGQALNIAIAANENAQLATLTDKDVQIRVVLAEIGSADFNKVPEAIPIGEAAARAAAAALSRYSLTPGQYAEWRADLGKLAALPNVTIDEVRVSRPP